MCVPNSKKLRLMSNPVTALVETQTQHYDKHKETLGEAEEGFTEK